MSEVFDKLKKWVEAADSVRGFREASVTYRTRAWYVHLTEYGADYRVNVSCVGAGETPEIAYENAREGAGGE